MDSGKIEKWHKDVRNAGHSCVALGWFAAVVGITLVPARIVAKALGVPELPFDFLGIVLVLAFAFCLIVLGNRVKAGINKRTKTHLLFLVGLGLVYVAVAIVAKEAPGILLIALLVSLMFGLYSRGRLMKVEGLAETLVAPQYRIKGKHWILFAGVTAILFCAAVFLELHWEGLWNRICVATRQTESIRTSESAGSVQWKEFISDTDKFRVLLPGEPARESSDLEVPDSEHTVSMHLYMIQQQNGTTYAVNVSVYPDEVRIGNPGDFLQTVLGGTVSSNPGNKLVSSKPMDLGKHTALDYHIQNNTVGLRGRIILVGSTMYQTIMVCQPTCYIQADFDRFISSFQVIE